jgi:hypothetical protein
LIDFDYLIERKVFKDHYGPKRIWSLPNKILKFLKTFLGEGKFKRSNESGPFHGSSKPCLKIGIEKRIHRKIWPKLSFVCKHVQFEEWSKQILRGDLIVIEEYRSYYGESFGRNCLEAEN